jgi:hypothetical protein
MKFPPNFTNKQKITFYNQRKREMEKRFIKSMNEGKDLLSNKINEEIKICEKELFKLTK